MCDLPYSSSRHSTSATFPSKGSQPRPSHMWQHKCFPPFTDQPCRCTNGRLHQQQLHHRVCHCQICLMTTSLTTLSENDEKYATLPLLLWSTTYRRVDLPVDAFVAPTLTTRSTITTRMRQGNKVPMMQSHQGNFNRQTCSNFIPFTGAASLRACSKRVRYRSMPPCQSTYCSSYVSLHSALAATLYLTIF